MSYDLAIWKFRPGNPDVDPRDIYASVVDDRSHRSLEKFDVAGFKVLLAEKFGREGEESPVRSEVGDFTGHKANWLLINMAASDAAELLPAIIRLAAETGLTVFDPQDVSLNGQLWRPPTTETPVSRWSLKFEVCGDKIVYDPTDKVLVKKVRRLSPWKGSVFAVLTRSDGSFIQAGGGGVACVLERLDKGSNRIFFGRGKDKLYRASQDKPSFKTAEGTTLSISSAKVVMGTNDWFTNDQVAEAFEAFAHQAPFPHYIRWTVVSLRDKTMLKFTDMAGHA